MNTKSWDDVLASLDAILTGTYESPEAMATELSTVREALAAMIAEAQAGTTEEMALAAEAAEKAAAKVTRIETAIRAKRAMITLDTNIQAAANNAKAAFQNVPSGNTSTGVQVKSRPYRGKAFKQYGAKADEMAYRAGAALAALVGDARAAQYCKDNGVDMLRKDMYTGDDALGGYLVTPELEAAVSYYREERGVARSIMEVKTGTTATVERNRNVGGTNVKALGEGQTYDRSDVKFDRITATAKKFGALTVGTNELSDDSYVNLAEEIAKDHGYAHAVREDQVAFLGDGSSTYNSLVGINETFKRLVTDAGGTWTTDAHKLYAAGIQVATGATVASVTIADLIKMQAKVATFPGLTRRYYIPSQIWYGQVEPTITTAGGNTTTQIVDGLPRTFLNGYEVVFTDELYTPLLSAENNQFVAFFGDASAAGLFYDRQGLTVTPSTEAGFLTDEIFWKSTTRYGVNWWNIGNASTTASARKRGALAALVTKNA